MAEGGNTCVICATVTTGLESVSKDECKQKLKCNIVKEVRGKIYCEIPVTKLENLKELRSVENLSIVVKEFDSIDCYSDDILERLEKLPKEFDWNSALKSWQQYTGYEGHLITGVESEASETFARPVHVPVDSQAEAQDQGFCLQDIKSAETNNKDLEETGNKKIKCDLLQDSSKTNIARVDENPDVLGKSSAVEGAKKVPSFRVTCSRANIKRGKHFFTSMEAAAQFGGGINDSLGWKVDLSNADIEVLLRIVDSEVSVSLALTRVTRGKRNIVHFGPTTLKSTLAYALLHLADIKPGDVVCDPMCGGGSIPLESALNWRSCVHLCGDNHELAPPRVLSNVQEIIKDSEGKRQVLLDIYQWDVCNLPLKQNSVDAIVTDLPFGKKCGSKQKNWDLYPKALMEMARVCRPQTGRVVLLTQDKKVMSRVLRDSLMWRKKTILWINMGGLAAGVYVLYRTSNQV